MQFLLTFLRTRLNRTPAAVQQMCLDLHSQCSAVTVLLFFVGSSRLLDTECHWLVRGKELCASHRQRWSFLGHNCISGGCCPVVGHLCLALPIAVDSGGLFSWLAWFNHWEKAEDQS